MFRSPVKALRNSLATSVVICFQVASPWNLLHTILPLASCQEGFTEVFHQVFGALLLVLELLYWRRRGFHGRKEFSKVSQLQQG